MTKKSRPEAIRVRVAPTLRAEIERAAESDHRSISDMIRVVLIDWATQRVTAGQQQAGA